MKPSEDYFAFMVSRTEGSSELNSLVGLVNYYCKFIPNMSTLVHPLNRLLSSNVHWAWKPACQEAFTKLKEGLKNFPLLAHYDLDQPVSLAADASSFGLGAVVTCPSRWRWTTDCLCLAFSICRWTELFRDGKGSFSNYFWNREVSSVYLYGRSFNLLTDHRPLTLLLGPKRGIPVLAALLLRRWAIYLSA